MTRNFQGWTWVWMRQRLASEKGPSPDTVVKTGGKKIVLRWGKCVRLEETGSMRWCLEHLRCVARHTRLGWYELTCPTRARSGRASCKKRTSNISILSHRCMFLFFNVSDGRHQGEAKKKTYGSAYSGHQ